MAVTTKTVGAQGEIKCTTANVLHSTGLQTAYTTATSIPANAIVTGCFIHAKAGSSESVNVRVKVGSVEITGDIASGSLLNAADKMVSVPLVATAMGTGGGLINFTASGSGIQSGEYDVTICYVYG
jgi:hypothetical protein